MAAPEQGGGRAAPPAPGAAELFTLHLLALLVQALIERELRLAMKRDGISELLICPEQRDCRRPPPSRYYACSASPSVIGSIGARNDRWKGITAIQ